MLSPETLSVIIPVSAATIMAIVGLYVKDMVITSIKKHLTEVLPGLFAIEFQKYRDKTDNLYAPVAISHKVDDIDTRLKAMELWRAGG